MIGIKTDPNARATSSLEELRGAIDLHGYPGEEESAEERAMLHSILDLGDVEVGEIMVHRKNMTMIDASLSNDEIVAQALASPHTRIPLWLNEPENIVGVLHAKDLLRALAGASWNPAAIRPLDIAAKPWFVPESTPLQNQLNAFLRRKAHFALVIDEYGALMGLITLEDILEEIVGDISDEHDIERSGIRMQPDGSVIINGSMPIRDLNRALDWHLPDDEATTTAGLVIHEARTIPEVGQVFTFYGFKFEVLRRQRNQIAVLRVNSVRPRSGAAV